MYIKDNDEGVDHEKSKIKKGAKLDIYGRSLGKEKRTEEKFFLEMDDGRRIKKDFRFIKRKKGL